MTPIHKLEQCYNKFAIDCFTGRMDETLGLDYCTHHPCVQSKGVTVPGRLNQHGWADRSKLRVVLVELCRENLVFVLTRPLADQIVHISMVLVISRHRGFQDGVGVAPSFVDPRRVLHAQLFKKFFECVRLADWNCFVCCAVNDTYSWKNVAQIPVAFGVALLYYVEWTPFLKDIVVNSSAVPLTSRHPPEDTALHILAQPVLVEHWAHRHKV